jgi:hypothetical protein
MPDQKRQPAFVMAILALLGVASLPTFLKSPDVGSKSAAVESPADVGTTAGASSSTNPGEPAPDEPHVRDLKPLLEYLADNKPLPVKNQDLGKYLSDHLDNTNVYCLVITLPDPIESTASGRFDEYLDVVQRAIELQGFILDRSLLPWKSSAGDKGSSAASSHKVQLPNKKTILTVETAGGRDETKSRPGLLVFKRLIDYDPAAPRALAPPSVLLAFLVPESPIAGIEKTAFRASLDLIDLYFQGKLKHEGELRGDPVTPKSKSILHIIAPCFNGSQRSLEIALADWSPASGGPYHLRLISGSSHMIERDRLKNIVESKQPHTITFHAMVHQIHDFKDAVLDYLSGARRSEKSDSGWLARIPGRMARPARYLPEEIAVMVESNSGLAQALVQRERDKGKPATQDGSAPIEFLFPLQVGGLRKAYEKAGLGDDKSASSSSAPLKLQIPASEGGAPRDLPRTFTPATSAALDELELTQVLTTIARRPYQAVGIFATDPFDVVFLARQVRRFCPNVRLFTSNADLLLARPGNKVDLRGMIVASTYPLYPSNQWMTTPYHDGPRVFFANRGSQGLYNATVAHLWEMGADERKKPPASTPQLLEFGLPYDITGKEARKPPIWISVVGERGIYPVKFVPTKDPSDYLYHPESGLEGRASAPWLPEEAAARKAAAVAAKASPHLLFWLICLFLLAACVFVAMITVRYVEWSSDPKKYERNPSARWLALGHVLRWLNCDVAERGPVQVVLVRNDADIPTDPTKRKGMIALKKDGDDFRLQVYDGAGDRLGEYDEKSLLALTDGGGVGSNKGIRRRLPCWLSHPLRHRRLARLRAELKPFWERKYAIKKAKEAFDASLNENIQSHFPAIHSESTKNAFIASLKKSIEDHPAPFESTEIKTAFIDSVRSHIDHNIKPVVSAEAKKAFTNSLVKSIHDQPPALPTPQDKKDVVDALIKIAGDRLAPFAYVDPKYKAPLAGKPYNPQSRFDDPEKNAYRPPVGAGLNIAILNLVVAGVSLYLFVHVILGLYPLDYDDQWSIVPFTLMTIALTAILASTLIALLECFRKRPEDDAPEDPDAPCKRARRRDESWRFLPAKPEATRKSWVFVVTFAFALMFWAAVIAVEVWHGSAVDRFFKETNWRIAFERFTSLPSGVTPVFPVFFLASSFAFGVFFQLTGRRLYRLSYLSSEVQDDAAEQNAARYDKILIETRRGRTEVDRLITQLPHAVFETNLWLKIALGFLVTHIFIRCMLRGIPGSLETFWFDFLFWLLFMIAFLLVVARALQLVTLWRCVRQMLRRAVQLPLSHAYDRMPARFKGWFFGEDDFSVREQLIRQQSHALGNRCSGDLADIFRRIEELTAKEYGENFFTCRPTDEANITNKAHQKTGKAAPPPPPSVWHSEIEVMRNDLKESSTLDSTRTVYPFLRPQWDSLPVEDVPKAAHDDDKSPAAPEWIASWPLTPWQRDKLNCPEQLALVRDWTRMAEDLIALQILRWFAPALSYLVPMMQFIVVGSLSLLLAAMSYPFDHQGWLTIMMACLIVFVGGVVTMILVGINRDELISRVSDTAPGRLTFDSNFLTSLVTTLGPLLGALLAISFDVSDLLRAWLGPLLQFF